MTYQEFTGTYSPEDNKLRLYSVNRLPADLYERVRGEGFIYAPKQGFFVAPMWTPNRADLLIELCGEIGDEDTSLVERAEDRAERFSEYKEKRTEDAANAREAVKAISNNIPFGQPILIGHHSERKARKDAERIENGLRKVVQMWDTAEYWKRRAAGALRHAKHKERPDVRARRIKGLEADKRKQERMYDEARVKAKIWAKVPRFAWDDQTRLALGVAGRYGCADVQDATSPTGWTTLYSELKAGRMHGDRAWRLAVESLKMAMARAKRWIDHYELRLTYERAMLDDAGGTVATKKGPEKGGAVRCWVARGSWLYIQKVNKISVTVLDNWGNGGDNFTRTVAFDKLFEVMSVAEIQTAREQGRLIDKSDKAGFFLREAPQDESKQEPVEAAASAQTKEEAQEESGDTVTAQKTIEAGDVSVLREQLRAGVQVVTAPQLFPTPAWAASEMVDLAEIEMGDRVLEPEAGTAAILKALPGVAPFGAKKQTAVDVVAVEINQALALALEASGYANQVICRDFLACGDELGKFDVILMNPPFENGADIKHIEHAMTFLKPNGRLVAICANGPRQNERLRPIAEGTGGSWKTLPAGTFKQAGTMVNSALLLIRA